MPNALKILLIFIFWFFGKFIMTLLVSAVGLILFSPLFLIAYISDWIQRRRKKDS
jgi:hypothetical protein